MNNNKSAISITDPNNPPSAKLANLIPKRPNSSSGQTDDEDDSSPRPRPSSAVGHPSSTVAPAGGESSSKDVQPWNGLDLGGIHLKTLAPSLFAFSHITSLYINHNSLTTLPSAVSSLRKLVTLDATGNQLRSIPPELGMLTCLKDLLLFDNQLSDLPPELGTLFQLETLGIAGNPLPDSLRLILEKDGSSALVTYLRDSCPVPLPPPDREWATIEADTGLGSDSPPESFTLLCYNILCERYATSQTYGYTPGWALAWDYRKELILQEVMGCGADFICLQVRRPRASFRCIGL
jgi:CCR4-NOT transcription complex subunit 6